LRAPASSSFLLLHQSESARRARAITVVPCGADLERRFRDRRKYIPVGCVGDVLSPTLAKAPFEIHTARDASRLAKRRSARRRGRRGVRRWRGVARSGGAAADMRAAFYRVG